MIEIHNKNCRLGLKSFPDNHFDTLITDPPYGLKFMGKSWDHGIPGISFWKEFLRVCRPGAIALVFGGTRTYHRLACAIEDAGWEIRDCMMYLYGSGFPKSHDISKAIDKAKGAERKIIGDNPNNRPNCAGNKMHTMAAPITVQPITAPATDLAQLWNGWGTALKPAWEPIIVAMKPLDGTFAQNVEKWGVGGLWIDGGRIGTEEITINQHGGYNSFSLVESTKGKWQGKQSKVQGRWPANLILDEEAAAMLDEQSGISKSKARTKPSNTISKPVVNIGGGWKSAKNEHTDSGGASRFFYCAKASRSERGEGNIHPTIKPLKLMEYLCKLTKTPTGGTVLDPFAGSGTTGLACMNTGRDCVMFEKSIPYFEILKARIKGAKECKK